MKSEKDILPKIGRNLGMTVPDGYFADFAARMAKELPERENAPKILPRSTWQKVRPYVYLAAMFMGIWCMMKMFSVMAPSGSELSIDNNSVLAEALSNETFLNEYYISDVNDYDILEEMYDEGITSEELTR